MPPIVQKKEEKGTMQAKGENAHPFVASLIVLCGAFLQSVASERTGSALSSDLGEAAETGLNQISASILGH